MATRKATEKTAMKCTYLSAIRLFFRLSFRMICAGDFAVRLGSLRLIAEVLGAGRSIESDRFVAAERFAGAERVAEAARAIEAECFVAAERFAGAERVAEAARAMEAECS